MAGRPATMKIAVRGPSGTVRVEVNPKDTLVSLFDMVGQKLSITEAFSISRRGPTGVQELSVKQQGGTVADAGIVNRDQLFVTLKKSAQDAALIQNGGGGAYNQSLDEVDRLLDSEDGMVKRGKNPLLCTNCDGGRKCIHCADLHPFDPEVLNKRDPPIKFLSFHSYIRKLKNDGRGRLINLGDLRCTVDMNCKHCPGWPRGSCTKCIPSTVIMKRQPFRHVDNLNFNSSAVFNSFLDGWRKAGGLQRAGFLYGKYEKFDYVPLGIKATVAAIYEPPQTGDLHGLELLDDPHAELVDKIAAALGLSKVGWVFTDLEQDSSLQGQSPDAVFKYKRFVSDTTTNFSAGEILQAAIFQSMNPNKIDKKYSSEGTFGSKFVTCVVSGGEDHTIIPKAYQATNQAMSLAQAGFLMPSTRETNKMYVRPSSSELYVPEILYEHTNQYGLQVKSSASPEFPSDFLQVQLEAGFAKEEEEVIPFPVENREGMGEIQDLAALNKYLNHASLRDKNLFAKLSNLHVLYFLATNQIVPIDSDDLNSLLSAISKKDANAVEVWAASSTKFTTLTVLMTETAEASGGFAGQSRSVPSSGSWACPACTFLNAGSANACAVCETPR